MVAQEVILDEDFKPCDDDSQGKQEVGLSRPKKVESVNVRWGLVYAILVNIIILASSIGLIALFITVGGLLADPFLILSILLVMFLFTMMETLKLVDEETRCKKLGKNNEGEKQK